MHETTLQLRNSDLLDVQQAESRSYCSSLEIVSVIDSGVKALNYSQYDPWRAADLIELLLRPSAARI